MFKKIILCTLLLCLNACADTKNYEIKLNQEVGKTATQLIQSFGQPSRIKTLANNQSIYTYSYVNNVTLPLNDFNYNAGMLDEDEMFYPFTYGGDEIPDGTLMGENINTYCQTKFFLQNNIVKSWQYKGNACVAM